MIDLDAVIAAEVTGDPIEVQLAGTTFLLRPEMPWNTPSLLGQSDPAGAARSLVIDPGQADAFAEAFLADNPSWKQITARFNAIYATGESSAS